MYRKHKLKSDYEQLGTSLTRRPRMLGRFVWQAVEWLESFGLDLSLLSQCGGHQVHDVARPQRTWYPYKKNYWTGFYVRSLLRSGIVLLFYLRREGICRGLPFSQSCKRLHTCVHIVGTPNMLVEESGGCMQPHFCFIVRAKVSSGALRIPLYFAVTSNELDATEVLVVLTVTQRRNAIK